MRNFTIITPASLTPVSLTEVKAHLKVDTTADDTLITNLIVAATQSCEIYTNRFFIETEIKQYSDSWKETSTLYKSVVESISLVQYYDSDNTLRTLDPADYYLDKISKPARFRSAFNKSFPNIASRINAIEITYKVGERFPADVEDGVKQAILLTIGNWYANRESVITGRTATELPLSSQYLLDQYKIQVC